MFRVISYGTHLQEAIVHVFRKYSSSVDEVYTKSLLNTLSQKSLKLPPSSETHPLESKNNLTEGLPDTEAFSVHKTRQFPKCNQVKHFEKPFCELTLRHANRDTLKTPIRTFNNLLRKVLDTPKSTQSLPANSKLLQKQIKAYLHPSQTPKESIEILSQWFKELELSELVHVPLSSANLAAYIPSSFTLSQLVKLGVNLSKVEAVPGVANMLVKLDFHNDIEPILWGLSDFGFKPKQIARIITAFPKILKLPLCEISARLTYFTDRKVSSTDVVTMICRVPNILEKPPMEIDKNLGQIKSLIQLKNSEVVEVITTEPKIITHPLPKIKDIFVVLSKMMGFSQSAIHKLVLTSPKLLITEREHLSNNFKIMHWHLNLPVDLIQIWPEALSAAPHLLHQRCTFLVHRKLFQPDPTKPLYTPLSSIVLQDDDEFCRKYGFTTEEDYDNFLRTL
ncbi:unnamed protein product [Schistosoma rodhaini]|uniref:hypothetical protein n=1 Tax=Schistosoma mansoni TaxID=6183 RepID=UPI0001A62660|nr:hypothetical protein Smp_171940 [Schistosoma mansoni]CAH8663353.1 unnamed protein product [Schistosoma rodhaini]|eukprot:XP_018654257.1 hypothetical protein Smp_171940 [Schistosoma mansoni]